MQCTSLHHANSKITISLCSTRRLIPPSYGTHFLSSAFYSKIGFASSSFRFSILAYHRCLIRLSLLYRLTAVCRVSSGNLRNSGIQEFRFRRYTCVNITATSRKSSCFSRDFLRVVNQPLFM